MVYVLIVDDDEDDRDLFCEAVNMVDASSNVSWRVMERKL